MIFLDAPVFNNNICSHTLVYLIPGLDDSDAAAYCMTTDGIGGSPNIDYFVDNGVNVNIDFPTCGYSAEDLDLLATA